jgi:TonB family protein
MTVDRTTLALAAFATLLLLTDTRISASDQLNRARELYQAAAYDEALVALNGATADPAEAVEIRQYRVLCLIALDRRDEAERAMAALVDESPFYRLPEDETSPRVRALFAEVRRSVLPGIVQRTYANAKAAFDRKDADAAERFDRVLALLNDPDLAGDASLADLATVAAGFRDLSRAAAPAPVLPAAVGTSPAGQGPAAVAAAASAAPGSTAEVARGGIVPPIAISQVLPPIQTSMAREWVGEIEVVIDAGGKVASARMIRSINPGYDTQLLRAARGWTYRPATRDGVPTQTVKLVNIRLDSRPECSPRTPVNCRPVDR